MSNTILVERAIGFTGRKHSLASRAQISATLKGRKKSAESAAKRRGENNGLYKHGLAKYHFWYKMYKAMIYRCYNLENPNYRNYGKRGVTVQESWHDPYAFIFGLLALLGDCPPGYSLDRINPHGDYVEWNVRWADRETQRINIRKNVPDYYSQCGEH